MVEDTDYTYICDLKTDDMVAIVQAVRKHLHKEICSKCRYHAAMISSCL